MNLVRKELKKYDGRKKWGKKNVCSQEEISLERRLVCLYVIGVGIACRGCCELGSVRLCVCVSVMFI